MIFVFALVAWKAPHPNSPAAAAFIVVAGSLVTLALFTRWRRHLGPRSVTMAEYVALLWLLLYALAALADTVIEHRLVTSDWIYILPPLSALPPAARMLLGDDGDPVGRARTTAFWLHRLVGWLLIAWGTLFVVTGFLIFVSPLPLVPGIIHVRAGSDYRERRPAPASRPLKPRFDQSPATK